MITAESSAGDVAKWLQEYKNGIFAKYAKNLSEVDGADLLGYSKEDLVELIQLPSMAIGLHNALHPTTGKADKFVCFFTDLQIGSNNW